MQEVRLQLARRAAIDARRREERFPSATPLVQRWNTKTHWRGNRFVSPLSFVRSFIFVRSSLGTLCTWFHEYSTRDETLASTILQLLKHASTDDLEQNRFFNELVDREKKLIYKTLSEFLEEQTGETQQKTLASGDA